MTGKLTRVVHKRFTLQGILRATQNKVTVLWGPLPPGNLS